LPDVPVRADGQLTMLHRVLRGGRHVLLVPADPSPVLNDALLRRYLDHLDVVTTDAGKAPGRGNNGTGPVILVRPDGHVGARGRPGSMHAVTDYLHDLFGEPASDRGAAPAFRPGSAAGIVVF
jgi:hypothetical protein